jgi:Uma2 family endonuclease
MNPGEVSRMSEPAIMLPHRPPYTVDDLYEMPDDGNRYEVLGGQLLVSPWPTPLHQWVAQEINRLFKPHVPSGVFVLNDTAVMLPDGDGPVPDVVVSSASPRVCPRWFPADHVHTVVEVVSPSNAKVDRMYKPQIYADAGIPCYWRVELQPWRAHRGSLPLIVVRLSTPGGWQTTMAEAGSEATLPLVFGRDAPPAEVRFDPAVLIDF